MYKRQPDVNHNKVKFIQLSQVDDQHLLAVIVMNNNMVRNKMLDLYAVSYTHLDVYKRQGVASMSRRCMNRRRSGVVSSNAVGKMVLSPGMNMMKGGKLKDVYKRQSV